VADFVDLLVDAAHGTMESRTRKEL
jgi:hypothetical protein